MEFKPEFMQDSFRKSMSVSVIFASGPLFRLTRTENSSEMKGSSTSNVVGKNSYLQIQAHEFTGTTNTDTKKEMNMNAGAQLLSPLKDFNKTNGIQNRGSIRLGR